MCNVLVGQAHQPESDVHPGGLISKKKRVYPQDTLLKAALPALRWVIQ